MKAFLCWTGIVLVAIAAQFMLLSNQLFYGFLLLELAGAGLFVAFFSPLETGRNQLFKEAVGAGCLLDSVWIIGDVGIIRSHRYVEPSRG